MVHARRPGDWTNLPMGTSYLPPGYPLEVRDTPWPTEFVSLGAYANLPPVTVKPSTPQTYAKHSRNDSGIGLAADEGKVEEEELMGMEEEHFDMKYDPGSDLDSGLADDEDYDGDYEMEY